MSAEEASPRPWRMEEYGGDQPCCLVDAEGRAVGVQYGDADAALIVDAVNERDRLRELLRRVARILPPLYDLAARDACARAFARGAWGVDSSRWRGEDLDGLFREIVDVAGCGPCHDGRVAGSPTPPRAEVAKKSNV